MKKMLVLTAALLIIGALSGCGSVRTPATGKYHGNNYYCTFFGFSLESAVYGNGFIVNPNCND